jgi:hypothetical protein
MHLLLNAFRLTQLQGKSDEIYVLSLITLDKLGESIVNDSTDILNHTILNLGFPFDYEVLNVGNNREPV